MLKFIEVTTLATYDSGANKGYFNRIVPGPVAISESGSATATVHINNDTVYKGLGEITLNLEAGPGYSVEPAEQVRTVRITEDESAEITHVSVYAKRDSIVEGMDAEFTVVAFPNPVSEIEVDIRVGIDGGVQRLASSECAPNFQCDHGFHHSNL